MTVQKLCKECGQPLVLRVQKATGNKFLGCSAWPQCEHTEPLPTEFLLRLQGHKPLPGFE